MNFLHSSKNIDLSGSTLLLPLVSLGNVAQLASELLLHKFDLKCIGVFDATNHIPVVSARDDSHPTLTFYTPVELYANEDASLCLLLQRSPPLKAKKEQFIDALLNFIKDARFKQTLVISGIDAALRVDKDIQIENLFRSIPSPIDGSSSISTALSEFPQHSDNHFADIPFLPAAGITKRLLEAAKSHELSLDTLLMYVVEGDNRGDARLLASVVSGLISPNKSIPPEAFPEPKSWQTALYGMPSDQHLFG